MKNAAGLRIVPLLSERLKAGKLVLVPSWRKASDRTPRAQLRGIGARFIPHDAYTKWLNSRKGPQGPKAA